MHNSYRMDRQSIQRVVASLKKLHKAIVLPPITTTRSGWFSTTHSQPPLDIMLFDGSNTHNDVIDKYFVLIHLLQIQPPLIRKLAIHVNGNTVHLKGIINIDIFDKSHNNLNNGSRKHAVFHMSYNPNSMLNMHMFDSETQAVSYYNTLNDFGPILDNVLYNVAYHELETMIVTLKEAANAPSPKKTTPKTAYKSPVKRFDAAPAAGGKSKKASNKIR